VAGRPYGNSLTVDVNAKGVLDVDVVKGCTAGIAAHGSKGCYQACYAASIALFRGIDFSRAVVRHVHTKAQAALIERAVKSSPYGFFRIGTMGDPCHAWEETVRTVEWLAPYAIPVIFVVMTGDSRDKNGAYYCSEAETELFMRDQGLSVYNRIVYLESEFTRLAHAKRTLNTRKFPKREQKIIVAYKGKIKNIDKEFQKIGRL
jgi:hypothetical protein